MKIFLFVTYTLQYIYYNRKLRIKMERGEFEFTINGQMCNILITDYEERRLSNRLYKNVVVHEKCTIFINEQQIALIVNNTEQQKDILYCKEACLDYVQLLCSEIISTDHILQNIVNYNAIIIIP